MDRHRQVALLGIVFTCIYVVCRLRFVGDCDSWAYFAQAQLFLGRDPGLHAFPDAFRSSALTPLGMDVARGGYVSAFPPGYSLLMAFAGLVGGEYWVNPILGGASVVLVYLAVSPETRHSVALGAAALWGLCPLVAMNATDVMSDMAATVAALGSYVLVRRERVRLAGLVFGLSMMIRPMNVLFAGAVPFILPRRRAAWLGFLVSFAAGASVSAGMHLLVWGALLSPTYRANTSHFRLEYFLSQFHLYAWQTLLHLGPILPFALVQIVRKPRASLPEAAWFASFLLVYPFGGPIDIDWTRARFLLPAYPALFVLAARAMDDALWLVREKSERWAKGSVAIGLAAAASWGAVCVVRSVALGALAIHPSRDADCDTIAARLPRTSLVGASEFSGSLRLYAGIETFDWLELEALSFARTEFAKGRDIYMLLEPYLLLPNREHSLASRFTVVCDLAPQFPLSGGYVMNKVVGMQKRGHTRVVLTNPLVGWSMLDGWLSPSEFSSESARAAACDRATLKLITEAGRAHDVDLTAAAPEGSEARIVEVSVREHLLGRFELGQSLVPVRFRIPEELAGLVTLELHFPGAPSCGAKRRTVVARVQKVETHAVGR